MHLSKVQFRVLSIFTRCRLSIQPISSAYLSLLVLSLVVHSLHSNNLPSWASPIIKECTIPSQCHCIHKQQSIIQRNKLSLAPTQWYHTLKFINCINGQTFQLLSNVDVLPLASPQYKKGDGVLSSIQFRFDFFERFPLHKTLCRKKYPNIRWCKNKLI